MRHGGEMSKVQLGGRMVNVLKPRVRAVDGSGEITLDTWEALSSSELLDHHTLISLLAGVSSRNYSVLLEPVGKETDAKSSSTSHSAVSRRFIQATRDRLADFRSRPLDDRRFVVVYIEGFSFADETLVGALGVDENGVKVPLSVIHGTTENKAVCMKLLNNLEDMGFDPNDGVLFVIDGGKAIYYAIKDKWGDVALIQRCRVHYVEFNIMSTRRKTSRAYSRNQTMPGSRET